MKTRRLLKGTMLTAVLLTGTAGFYSCSQDEGTLPDDGSRVAVQFTSQMVGGGTAVQTSASQMRSSAQSRTTGTEAQRGTTASGIAYADFLAADGFETRAFTLPTADNASGGTLRSGSDVLQTRTTTGGTQWATDDKVGIFMLSAPGTLSTSIVGGANNIQYNTKAAGASAALSPANTAQTIYYPSSGNVDFIAYYPYRTTPGTNPYIYKVNVATQSTAAEQAAIDVLYSKNVTGKARNSTAVALEFDHALSKIVINVKRGTGFVDSDFTGMKVSLTGFPTTADLALSNGTTFTSVTGTATAITPLKWETPASGSVATFEAIVIPQSSGSTSRKATFTVGVERYTWDIKSTEISEQGKTHTYNITVNKTGITIVSGSPAITAWTGTGGTPESGTAEQIDAVKIKAGTFLMGSSDGSASAIGAPGDPNYTPKEPDRGSNETQHQVTLTKDFYMSKYQITNAQYAAFLNAKHLEGVLDYGNAGSYNDAAFIKGTTNEPLVRNCSSLSRWGVEHTADGTWAPIAGYKNHPVIYVTWFGAKAFADWAGGALPTETQWEYACRGGLANKPFGVGDGYALNNTLANFYWSSSWSWDGTVASATIGSSGSYPGKTQEVGIYAANGYGLYDMHGNVYEWCTDWYDGNYYNDPLAGTDPTGPIAGNFRVLRGGGWSNGALFCRSAYRDGSFPDDADSFIGFRVVFPH